MIKLICPYYGTIKIKEDLTLGSCFDCLGPINNPKESFIKILLDLSYLSIEELDKLTNSDINTIALHYTKKLDVEEIYTELIKSGIIPQEAFFLSFKESKTYNSLDKTVKQIRQFTKSFQSPFLKLNQYASLTQTLVGNIQRMINPFQVAALQTKTIIDSYQNQARIFTSAFEKIAISQRNVFLKNQELFKSFELLQHRISSTAIVFNQISVYKDNIAKQFESFRRFRIEPIFTSELIFKLNESILQSRNIVTFTNDYFSQYDIKIIKNNISQTPDIDNDELSKTINQYDDFSECEGLALHTKTSEVVIGTNDLLIDIKEELRDFKALIKQYKPLLDRFNILLSPPSFLNIIREFAHYIASEYFSMFWSKPGENFNSNPESIAKGNLGMFLKGRFGDIAFVGTELMRGNGFIDLFVNFLGINYIIELKMIGVTWPISWVESGIEQLNNYMNTYNNNNSYLVVFDGRKTKKGKQLQEYYDVTNGRIHVIVIPIFHEK